MGRRLSLKDMNIIKHDIEIRNARIKRGEIVPKTAREYHVICGCGAVGCNFVVSMSKEDLEYNSYF